MVTLFKGRVLLLSCGAALQRRLARKLQSSARTAARRFQRGDLPEDGPSRCWVLACPLLALPVFADEPAPADPLSFNIGAVATIATAASPRPPEAGLQGGIDYAHSAVSTSAPGPRPSSGSRTPAVTAASRSTSTAATRPRSRRA
jgi:hypothetical protein